MIEDSRLGIIYGLSCRCHPERGFRYVGQTVSKASQRRNQHVSDSFNQGTNLPVPSAQVQALTAVPGSFADLAAVRTYLNTLVTELKASPFFS